jgi:hypothetical protein
MSFYSSLQFPALLNLQKQWKMIAIECDALKRNNATDVSAIGDTREKVAAYLIKNKPQWISGWDGFDKWWNWGIALNYQFPLDDANIPKTVSLLKSIAGLKFASLSLFKGGCMLPQHVHAENERLLTFHLGLDVPQYCCAVNVDGNMLYEGNGQILVFDGTKPHYSFNASNKDRLILYGEFIADGGGIKN